MENSTSREYVFLSRSKPLCQPGHYAGGEGKYGNSQPGGAYYARDVCVPGVTLMWSRQNVGVVRGVVGGRNVRPPDDRGGWFRKFGEDGSW